MKKKISIFWFRRDLRLEDQHGLYEALRGGHPVLALFIFDQNILQELTPEDARVSYIYQNLVKIDQQLKGYGSSLEIQKGKPEDLWYQLIKQYDIQYVYANKDYEPYALSRDQKIAALLKQHQVGFLQYKDQVIFEENEILKPDGKPYTIFTPYSKKWKARQLFEGPIKTYTPDFSHLLQINTSFPSLPSLGFKISSIECPDYQLDQLHHYAETRDFPALDSCSHLSVHLRFGTVSIREIIRSIPPKHETFLNELIWREFFMQILFHFPRVVHENFKKKYDGIQWINKESDFELWCQGKTGYPMVDAGMRELKNTGLMHNRVRMICASFLCKHLLIDWQWGESYFAQHLLDYELSSNNGNWQWASGTGCDSAPYFRIFNPITQLKKFDKEGIYINKWIPELANTDYPSPIIDHPIARVRALDHYKKGLNNQG